MTKLMSMLDKLKTLAEVRKAYQEVKTATAGNKWGSRKLWMTAVAHAAVIGLVTFASTLGLPAEAILGIIKAGVLVMGVNHSVYALAQGAVDAIERASVTTADSSALHKLLGEIEVLDADGKPAGK